MSTTAVTSDQRRSFREQAVGWLSPLNLHLLGAGALALLSAYLLVHCLVLWSRTGSAAQESIQTAKSQQAAADLAARPLRGMDKKLEVARNEADKFYANRLPFAYSDVAAELGALAKKDNVRLSRVQYVQAPPAHGLTEVRMDAQLTGDYRSLAHFLNGLERDRSFFLISQIALSGQQSGIVNLRVRIMTYLREPMPASAASTNGGAR
ncbi:MAG: hypothetical protein JSS87_03305 [Acidobacteria bacterium]|nr:hypothetical protein [Acidobacteriota bacterium]